MDPSVQPPHFSHASVAAHFLVLHASKFADLNQQAESWFNWQICAVMI